jgi:hypothetical protein
VIAYFLKIIIATEMNLMQREAVAIERMLLFSVLNQKSGSIIYNRDAGNCFISSG